MQEEMTPANVTQDNFRKQLLYLIASLFKTTNKTVMSDERLLNTSPTFDSLLFLNINKKLRFWLKSALIHRSTINLPFMLWNRDQTGPILNRKSNAVVHCTCSNVLSTHMMMSLPRLAHDRHHRQFRVLSPRKKTLLNLPCPMRLQSRKKLSVWFCLDCILSTHLDPRETTG